MGRTIPDKLYFKIGEVAHIAAIKPSVLRFWETEFVFLHPEKSTTGQRLYSRQEVELVLQVRNLLYDVRFTIEGVKQQFSKKGKLKLNSSKPESLESAESVQIDKNGLLLHEIKLSLLDMRKQLA